MRLKTNKTDKTIAQAIRLLLTSLKEKPAPQKVMCIFFAGPRAIRIEKEVEVDEDGILRVRFAMGQLYQLFASKEAIILEDPFEEPHEEMLEQFAYLEQEREEEERFPQNIDGELSIFNHNR